MVTSLVSTPGDDRKRHPDQSVDARAPTDKAFGVRYLPLARLDSQPRHRIIDSVALRYATGTTGDHRLASSTLRVRIRTDAPWTDVERLVGEAEQECAVCRAIAGNVSMRVLFERLA
jgi:hypothetical protein